MQIKPMSKKIPKKLKRRKQIERFKKLINNESSFLIAKLRSVFGELRILETHRDMGPYIIYETYVYKESTVRLELEYRFELHDYIDWSDTIEFVNMIRRKSTARKVIIYMISL